MASFRSITVFLAAISSTLAEQSLCTGNGCTNFTVYLGPRWGSKVVRVPNNQLEKVTPNVSLVANRPVPINNSIGIDYEDYEVHISHPFKLNANKLVRDGILNLTNMGIQGDYVKDILHSLNEEVCKELEELYLNDNPLQYIYDDKLLNEFSRLTKLKVLGLSGTSLHGLAPFNLPMLEVLDLSNNLFHRLPAITINLPNLRELDLSKNRLSVLLDDFANLDNLRVLSLANNDMFLLSTNTLKSLKLDKLYMNNNQFQMISQIMLDPVTSPNVTIFLSGNPLECDCILQEELLNRAWPKVGDWDQLKCIGLTDEEPQLISDFARECQGLITWMEILQQRTSALWDKLHYSFQKLDVKNENNFIVFSVLLFASVLLLLVLLLQIRTAKKKESKANDQVPYTILVSSHLAN